MAEEDYPSEDLHVFTAKLITDEEMVKEFRKRLEANMYRAKVKEVAVEFSATSFRREVKTNMKKIFMMLRMTLLFVLIATRVDLLAGTSYLRDAVCIAFIANEALSIMENAGLMGVPLPEILKKAIDILQRKGADALPESTTKL